MRSQKFRGRRYVQCPDLRLSTRRTCLELTTVNFWQPSLREHREEKLSSIRHGLSGVQDYVVDDLTYLASSTLQKGSLDWKSNLQLTLEPLSTKDADSFTKIAISVSFFTGSPPFEKVRSCWVSVVARSAAFSVDEHLKEFCPPTIALIHQE